MAAALERENARAEAAAKKEEKKAAKEKAAKDKALLLLPTIDKNHRTLPAHAMPSDEASRICAMRRPSEPACNSNSSPRAWR